MRQNQGQVSWMLVAVASFAVVASWQLAVRPLDRKFETQWSVYEAAVAELERGQREMDLAPKDPRELLSQLEVAAASFSRAFGAFDGASTEYNRFDPLARRAGVMIKRLEPSHREAAFQEGSADVTTGGFVVECEGTLDAASEFLRLIQFENGLSRITAVRIIPVSSPTSAQDLVHMSLKTEHVTISGLFESAEGGQ